MGRIGNQYFSGGQIPNASELNAVYDSVAGDTVEDVNLDTEWANRQHFSPSNSITSLYTYDYDGSVAFTVSSTSFVTINNTGTPSKVLPNYIAHSNVLVRVHASGMVAATSLNTDDGNGQTGQTNYNTYAFQLLMSINGSTSPSTISLANCTYSITGKAQVTNVTSTGTQLNIDYRSFAFSGLAYVSAGTVIDAVELQALVGLTGNTINIEHNHIQLIIVEN
jgi:hypothetical protein